MYKWVVLVFLIVVIFHIAYYNKLNIISIFLIMYLLYVFQHKVIMQKKAVNDKQQNIKQKIKRIIKSFYITQVESSNMDVKIPTRYKYLFIKPDLLPILYRLRFVRNFTEESYMIMFVILERFYKVYYNIIIERYDIENNIGRLKAFYENMKELKDHMLFSVPKKSKNIRGFVSPLDIVIKENIDMILSNMKSKLNLLLSLNG